MAREYRYENYAEFNAEMMDRAISTVAPDVFRAAREMAPPETFFECMADLGPTAHGELSKSDRELARKFWDAAYAAGSRHALRTASEGVPAKLETGGQSLE